MTDLATSPGSGSRKASHAPAMDQGANYVCLNCNELRSVESCKPGHRVGKIVSFGRCFRRTILVGGLCGVASPAFTLQVPWALALGSVFVVCCLNILYHLLRGGVGRKLIPGLMGSAVGSALPLAVSLVFGDKFFSG